MATFERPATRNDEFSGKPGLVRFLELPERRFVMIDGDGPAGELAFAPRIPGLYGTAYPLRYALKRRGIETKVGPLEGLWWTVHEATDAEVADALERGRSKLEPPFAGTLRVERFDEGRAAQILHVGSYAEERGSIERLHRAIEEARLRPRGRHHEIYLGDPRRSAPDRLKTLLRMPVA